MLSADHLPVESKSIMRGRDDNMVRSSTIITTLALCCGSRTTTFG